MDSTVSERRHVRHKIERILWESADSRRAVGTSVAKDEVTGVARALVLDQIKVHVEPIGA
jgi:hypothetical protein